MSTPTKSAPEKASEEAEAEQQQQQPPPEEEEEKNSPAPDQNAPAPGAQGQVRSVGQNENENEIETNVAQSEQSDKGEKLESQGGDKKDSTATSPPPPPPGDVNYERNLTQTDDSKGENEKSDAATDIGSGMGSGFPTLISGTKRGREGDPIHVGSSSGSKPKRKCTMELPSSAPVCYICKKPFGSWKAVFGHLRSHPNRQTRGAFPPPTFTPECSPQKNNDNKFLEEQLAPTLLNLAHETMKKMSQDNSNISTASTRNASSSASRTDLDIDLNYEPRTRVPLDLNVPPPPEKDPEEDPKEDDIDNDQN